MERGEQYYLRSLLKVEPQSKNQQNTYLSDKQTWNSEYKRCYLKIIIIIIMNWFGSSTPLWASRSIRLCTWLPYSGDRSWYSSSLTPVSLSLSYFTLRDNRSVYPARLLLSLLQLSCMKSKFSYNTFCRKGSLFVCMITPLKRSETNQWLTNQFGTKYLLQRGLSPNRVNTTNSRVQRQSLFLQLEI